ncbi:hypothetical protein [Sinorhizobium medicae]|uniref:Uncharacterized protein n=1 Tax=Sinorhizobium medicae TaxID=110321 RepID=A0ABX4TDY2_9HYPH|nr:hypothetical protein [Sinorhizobium medicae]PLT93366.1 hypothetical protein BMJ33_32155 [Sinorhizobium medicae]PLU11135.1 hypothetical protein BMJ29_34965 [Sinorhizobium medicae]PLU79757.1 hypothetical protein BMJ19_11770 [Sinorhizobium medicae]
MHDREEHGQPEGRAATGLPLGVMLFSMLAITAYLIVGGAFLDQESENGAVDVPTPTLTQNDASE